jgi:hypothetical protein
LPFDERGAIELAVAHAGPGAEGAGALLAAAAWLRARRGLARPRALATTPGWDGGAKAPASCATSSISSRAT